jgi:signal peptidase I
MPPPDEEPGSGGQGAATDEGTDGTAGPGEPAAPGRPAGREARVPGSHRRRWLVELGILVLVAVVLAVLLRAFVVQVFYVPSTSMLPTLRPGDRILVDKLSYHLHAVDRGDIIVFARPPAEHCGGPVVPDLVKRVIGLPGDRISSRGNQVVIDGKPIPQPWLPTGTVLGKPIPPTVVPPNSFYVLGDNRARSCDSRYWGVVPRSLVVGKVVAVIWPLSRLHFF